MRLHTSLEWHEVADAIYRAKARGNVAIGVVLMQGGRTTGSRTHDRRFNVQLAADPGTPLPFGYRDQYGKRLHTRRARNFGRPGEFYDFGKAATWHEWGWFMAEVFALDPLAMFGSHAYGYDGVADFHRKTGERFHVENEVPVEVPAVLDRARARVAESEALLNDHIDTYVFGPEAAMTYTGDRSRW